MSNNFNQLVYSVVKKIPRGRVATYKKIAAAIKRPKAYRAVASALAKNQQLIKIPCHRVIKSTGEVGGYALGSKKKIGLLRKEGIEIKKGRLQDISQLYYF